MKCPVCKDVELVMSERQGVEIDYCPSCRGVWLDRGELDKIIEKSASLQNQNKQNPAQNNQRQNYNNESPHSQNNQRQNYNNESPHSQYNQRQNYNNESPHSQYNSHNNGYPKKKKEGFLAEIFDFDF